MKINLHCLSFLSFTQKIHKIPTIIEVKQLKWGENLMWNKCFHYFHVGHNYWHPIIATSFSQHNSSEFSSIMPEEFGEHLIRDQRPFLHTESLQIPSAFTAPWRCCFLQFTSLIFYRVRSEDRDSNGKYSFCAQWPILCLFWCLFWIVVLVEDPNTAHYKISNRGSQVLIFICWYLIESMMPCIWTRCSGPLAEKQAHNIKIQQYI